MSEEEIKARIEAVDREVAKAKDNVARIEGKLEELDREKEQILAGFKEIGVPPQEAKAKREASDAKAVVRTARLNLAQAEKAAQNTDLTGKEQATAQTRVTNARRDLASAKAGVRAARRRVRAAKRLRDQATARADKTGRTVNATTKNFNTKYPNSTYVVE